ncbi:type I phosphodiesterase/nucleotide pyrophosphatase [Bogoriella caseilytica]|uniref:Type I phosphodiesterase/nucleotide pyrophosphatase n=2 Tax=Bogoriella caseilytica TaxID=56055 RepID=A0A3N2BG89_9MICO|nr:type I phosphodiesterase/nucleotide pyrophosphatase [Bogoriella caseilytica]
MAPSELPVPHPGRQLRAVLPAALDATGVTTSSADRDSARDRADLGLPEATSVCVVLIDGLGLRQLAERSGHAPFLRSRLPQTQTLSTTTPSTTATALTALGTGELGGATGMLGYSLLDPMSPSHRPSAVSLVGWRDTTLDPRTWQPRPTLAEQLREQRSEGGSMAVAQIGPAKFASSGLTLCAFRGMEYVAAESMSDRVEAAVRVLRGGTRVAYLYWSEVDHVGHAHGWRSTEWGEEVERVDAELAVLARRLPRGTLLLVTADHGMVDAGERIDVAEDPRLTAGVKLVAGEERFAHVYCQAGEAESVTARWRAVLGDRAQVLSRAELGASGLVGSDLSRLSVAGDLVAIPALGWGIVDSRSQPARALAMKGVHGGLSPEELEVPLLAELIS